MVFGNDCGKLETGKMPWNHNVSAFDSRMFVLVSFLSAVAMS